MTFRIPIATFCFVMAVVSVVVAQPNDGDRSRAVQTLTGGNSRKWILTQVISTMGPEGCEQGETYTFSSDRSLIDEKCQIGPDGGGKLVSVRHQWSIEQKPPLDLIVRIDEKAYYLYLPNDPNSKKMRLQTRSREKTNPSEDLEFTLSED
jgi:hypothetical protein